MKKRIVKPDFRKNGAGEALKAQLKKMGMDEVKMQGLMYYIQKSINNSIRAYLEPILKSINDAHAQAVVAIQGLHVIKEVLKAKGLICEEEYDAMIDKVLSTQIKVGEICSEEISDEKKIEKLIGLGIPEGNVKGILEATGGKGYAGWKRDSAGNEGEGPAGHSDTGGREPAEQRESQGNKRSPGDPAEEKKN